MPVCFLIDLSLPSIADNVILYLTAKDPSHLDQTMKLAVALSAIVLSTTYHAQDFRDVRGDRLIGRKTLPIVFPSIARPSVSFGVLSWTIYLCSVWKLDIFTAAVFFLVACIVSGRFVLLQEVKEDKVSFHWYNVNAAPLCSSLSSSGNVIKTHCSL